jgi:subtilisin family serine protease
VDVFAPGVSILSAVATNDQSTATKTGTSMAAPFVTGVVATYLENHPVSRSYRSCDSWHLPLHNTVPTVC